MTQKSYGTECYTVIRNIFYVTGCLFFLLLISAGSKPGEFNENEFISHIKELHSNIYNAFNYSNESEIYNCLASSFSGDELDRQFYEFLKAIREFESEGYRNYIQEIDYDNITIEKRTNKQIRVYMKWKVLGLVKHQLHEHNRINIYEAVYRFEKLKGEDDWKIVDTQVLNSERIIFPKRYYDQPQPL